MAGEYISLSRGNEACKHVKNLLRYFGNTTNLYYLYTDSQSAEHLATQPNMTDAARAIDIRHHEIKQDYLMNNMRIGGVSSKQNTSDILTKSLQPPIHAIHCSRLHILTPTITTHSNTITNNMVFATLKHPISPPNKPSPTHPNNNDVKKHKRKAKKQRQRTQLPPPCPRAQHTKKTIQPLQQ
jgi:hypothetical protein